MPKERNALKKYNISTHRFLELRHHCLQYQDWKDELRDIASTLQSVGIFDTPSGFGNSDPTQKLAMRRAELERKCTRVEQTAIEADEEIYEYILKAVTNDGISYERMKTVYDIPCGKDMYYDRRRKFFWLLAQKI